jgi:hypothetical protein
MRTKKRNAVALNPDSATSAPDGNSNPSLANEESLPAEKLDRISFYVAQDGAPEWDRISPQTRERLTAILRNSKVQKELGVSQEEAKSISEIGFGEDEANALLDMLGGIDSMAASAIYKIPPEVCTQAFTFTSDQRRKINPPLHRVLNKWGPAMLKTWKDEIGLAMVLFATMNAQVRVMHVLEEKRKKNQPTRAMVTPIYAPEPKPPETEVAKTDETSFNAS